MDKVKGELIWIGDIDDLKEGDLEHIDFVLNLSSWCNSQLAIQASYAHISIADGDGDYADFEIACQLLWNRLNNDEDENILVNCAAGVSRSVAVATTAVALRRGTGFDEELGRVRSSRGIDQRPHPKLVEYGRRFVDCAEKTEDGDSR